MTRTSPRKQRSADHTPAIAPPRRSEDQLAEIRAFMEAHRMKEKFTPGAFGEFETELHQRLLELERDLLAEVMRSADVDAEAIEIEGRVHRRVLRSAQTYMTSAGPVTVERWLYKDRADGDARAVSPMDQRLGIVDGFWTEKAAKNALWVVTQMTPGKAEELFARVGNMAPSKSSLDRLPKALSDRWEAGRDDHEAALRDALVIPDGAVSVAVSLDGVLAPMEGTRPVEKRNQAAAEGRVIKGPVGYREVGCATLAFCDDKGDLLGAVRMARAPEPNKRTLKASLAAELAAALAKQPQLRIVKLADGVDDNWTFLSDELPDGVEVLDFFHATEHLHAAVAAAYGDGTRETQYRYGNLRETLRDDADGVAKVIRAVDHLRKKCPRSTIIERAAAYFRKHRRRMNYAAVKAQGLMIGSGVVEAACKTLVAQRLKLSGMRWGRAGAQAILTPRGWDQSDRFDEAWARVAATYQVEVHVLANIIALKPPSESRGRRGQTASR
jgi:hypothetical protein